MVAQGIITPWHAFQKRISAECWLLISICWLGLGGYALSLTTEETGFAGERIVDEFYTRAGRQKVLPDKPPTANGPDKIYRLKNGDLELHEVKTYGGWGGRSHLGTTKSGRQMSDGWVKDWAQKTLDSPAAASEEKSLAKEVLEQLKSTRLKRILDEINTTEVKYFKSSSIAPNGDVDVVLTEKMGPVRIGDIEAKLKNAGEQLRQWKAEKLKEANIQQLEKPAASFEEYKKMAQKRWGECEVRPGILAQDGKLIVSMRAGASVGLLVFAIDAGVATYRYQKGDSLKPEYERELQDAAIKGAAVGGATAVVVVLASNPGGWTILAVGAGAYIVTEISLQSYHEFQERKFVTLDDLAAIIGRENISHDIPLMIGE